MNLQNLKSVADFVKTSPLSEGQVRWAIFNAETNGLAEFNVVQRIGRRVYIDAEAFSRWVESGRAASAQAHAA